MRILPQDRQHIARYIKLVALFLLCAAVGFLLTSYTGAAQTEPLTVRWLVAHEPVSVFDRAKEAFAAEFERGTGRAVIVQAYGPSDYGMENGEVVPTEQVFALMDSGEIDVAATILTALPSLDLELSPVTTLALPYLFDGYAQSSKALEGEATAGLLKLVSERTSAEALAFTYSGGLKILALADKDVAGPAGVRGLRIGTPNGRLSQDTLAAFGATPVFLDPNPHVGEKNTDGLETTYTRIFTKLDTPPSTIVETYHSLFFTVVLASDSFFGSLTPQERGAFVQAMRVAAEVEREDSIALGEQNKRALQEAGTKIVEPTSAEKSALIDASRALYDKYSDVFPPELVLKLRASGE